MKFYNYQKSKNQVWCFSDIEIKKYLPLLKFLNAKYPNWTTSREIYKMGKEKAFQKDIIKIRSQLSWLWGWGIIKLKTVSVKNAGRPKAYLWKLNYRNFDYLMQIIEYRNKLGNFDYKKEEELEDIDYVEARG